MWSQGSFCWRECATRDAEAAKSFYCELLGWTAMEMPMPGDMGGTYTILKCGETAVAGLYQMDGPMFEDVPPHWSTYVAYDDVDAGATRAQELGGDTMGEPVDIPDVGRMAAVKDAQGAVLYLFKPATYEGDPPDGSTPGAFCWSELLTTDTGDAERFYTNLIGWTAQTQDMGEGPSYTCFFRGEDSVGGMFEMDGPQFEGVPPNWMNYVTVESVEATIEKAQTLGGTVLMPPKDVEGVGRFTTLQDPTGAVIAVIALAPKPAGE